MIELGPDDAALDPHALFLTGRAILLWPPAATQPSAVVLAARGAFTVYLRGAPYIMRALVDSGAYAAEWRRGRVLVTAA